MRCKPGSSRSCLLKQTEDSAGRSSRPTHPGTTWRIVAAADLSRAHPEAADALLSLRQREAGDACRYSAHAARSRTEGRSEAAALSGSGDREIPISLRAARV